MIDGTQDILRTLREIPDFGNGRNRLGSSEGREALFCVRDMKPG
jgi:hypothetical protein